MIHKVGILKMNSSTGENKYLFLYFRSTVTFIRESAAINMDIEFMDIRVIKNISLPAQC